MLKQLSTDQIFELFDRLAEHFHLLVPHTLPDGTRALLPWSGNPTNLFGDPIQRKPTCHFFPQTDLLGRLATDGTLSLPPETDKPLALCGLGSEDLRGIAFVDRFFSTEPADDIYLRKRKGALLIGLSGYAGPKRQFLPITERDCDIELIADQQYWLVAAYTGESRSWLKSYPEGSHKKLDQLRQKSQELTSPRKQTATHASSLLQDERVPDSFWEEISSRCIRCGGCNFSCPTCTCFCVQDRKSASGIERSRIWDSCQLDAFMREAGGHNPLGTEMLRTRRRIHHKLVDDPRRLGELGCVFCGRCDRACPTGIGMFAICEEIVRRFGN